MRFKLQSIFAVSAFIFFFGCTADTSNEMVQIKSIKYVDCEMKSANTIELENEKIKLVYDPKLDDREACRNIKL